MCVVVKDLITLSFSWWDPPCDRFAKRCRVLLSDVSTVGRAKFHVHLLMQGIHLLCHHQLNDKAALKIKVVRSLSIFLGLILALCVELMHITTAIFSKLLKRV